MTRAIILAAGQGSRLMPLTKDKPKCLVPIMGKSMLRRQLDVLEAADVTDIHIVTGYKAAQLEATGYPCTHNEDFEVTNMVETLFTALPFIEKKGDLIIAYGDIIYQPNNLAALLSCDGDMSLMIDKGWRALWELRLEDPLSDAETLLLDENNYVTELGKKPSNYDQVQGQYTGLIKIKAAKIPDFIAFYKNLDRDAIYDGKDFRNMYMTSFIQALINSGWAVKAALVNNGWLEVDTKDDLDAYEEMERDGKLKNYCILS